MHVTLLQYELRSSTLLSTCDTLYTVMSACALLCSCWRKQGRRPVVHDAAVAAARLSDNSCSSGDSFCGVLVREVTSPSVLAEQHSRRQPPEQLLVNWCQAIQLAMQLHSACA